MAFPLFSLRDLFIIWWGSLWSSYPTCPDYRREKRWSSRCFFWERSSFGSCRTSWWLL